MARLQYLMLLALGLLALAGCSLSSGTEASSSQAPGGGGNVSVAFYTADTFGESEVHTLQIADGPAELEIIVRMRLGKGALSLEVLDASGAVALAVQGAPGQEQVAIKELTTDAQGRLTYRIRATEARDGSYQLIYRPLLPPTPTPEPTPAPPTPTP